MPTWIFSLIPAVNRWVVLALVLLATHGFLFFEWKHNASKVEKLTTDMRALQARNTSLEGTISGYQALANASEHAAKAAGIKAKDVAKTFEASTSTIQTTAVPNDVEAVRAFGLSQAKALGAKWKN